MMCRKNILSWQHLKEDLTDERGIATSALRKLYYSHVVFQLPWIERVRQPDVYTHASRIRPRHADKHLAGEGERGRKEDGHHSGRKKEERKSFFSPPARARRHKGKTATFTKVSTIGTASAVTKWPPQAACQQCIRRRLGMCKK